MKVPPTSVGAGTRHRSENSRVAAAGLPEVPVSVEPDSWSLVKVSWLPSRAYAWVARLVDGCDAGPTPGSARVVDRGYAGLTPHPHPAGAPLCKGGKQT